MIPASILEHIYLHIPFCVKKCNYCSFYSIPFDKQSVITYLTAVHREIGLYKKEFTFAPLTVYFGGGTPSLLEPEELQRILQEFDPVEQAEVTLEMNPGSIDGGYLRDLLATDVNRISLGVQSFLDTELKLLGRAHTAYQAEKIISQIKEAGFSNLSIDLIFGLPRQTIEDVEYSLQKVRSLNPEHVSVYCLSLDTQVPLANQINEIPADDILAEFYLCIRQELQDSGYEQYEISNFCRPGYYSRHNLAGWDGRDYLGLGAGAVGTIGWQRYTNPQLPQYLLQTESGKIMPDPEILTQKQKEQEYVFLNLRKCRGLNLQEYQQHFQTAFRERYAAQIKQFTDLGLLILEKEFCRLDRAAYFISDSVLSEFI